MRAPYETVVLVIDAELEVLPVTVADTPASACLTNLKINHTARMTSVRMVKRAAKTLSAVARAGRSSSRRVMSRGRPSAPEGCRTKSSKVSQHLSPLWGMIWMDPFTAASLAIV